MVSNLSKWHPFAGQSLFPELGRLDELFGLRPDVRELMERSLGREGTFTPRVDVSETPDAYLITAEVPGCRPEDIEITLHGDRLTFRGEKHEETRSGDEDRQIVERRYGSFERSFTFPVSVDADSVEAESADGLLRISVKKRGASPSKRIEVKAGRRAEGATEVQQGESQQQKGGKGAKKG